MHYKEKKFTIPQLDNISEKSVEEHLGLYAGYVKNFNAITDLAGELMQDSTKNAHAISELMRRRSFEWGGMRLHELYFAQFEGGSVPMTTGEALGDAVVAQYQNPGYLMMELRQVAMMRGPGWAMLYFDTEAKQFLVGFSEQQHQGHFVSLPVILALDVWEHAYLLDHGVSGKAKYVDAFFKNINWSVIEKRFADIS